MKLVDRVRDGLAGAHLTAAEKRVAETLFAAIVPGETAGMPAFAALDRARFWECLRTAPGPSFGPGLRAMVHGLNLLPLADRRFRRTFTALSPDERETLLVELASDERYAVRQMLTTLKMVACFAYFDDPVVRARFDVASGGRP